MTRKILITVLAVTPVLGGVVAPPVLAAAVFAPTRFDDPAPGDCEPNDCSLREAIIASNASVGADTVNLAGGTYELSILGTAEEAAADGDLDITDDVTITGQGAGVTVIHAGGAATGERAFHVDPTAGGASPAATLAGFTITGGTGDRGTGVRAQNEARVTLDGMSLTGNGTPDTAFGGAVNNSDDVIMTIEDSSFTGNQANAFGGAIFNNNNSTITISNSLFSGNQVSSYGSAIYNDNEATLTITDTTVSQNAVLEAGEDGAILNQNTATLTLDRSLVAGNTSAGLGGGLYLKNDSVSTIRNTTVSGNRAGEDGGGIFISQNAVATLNNVTITLNVADSDGNGTGNGGGIFVDPAHAGSLTLQNTILAGNSDPTSAPDCSGAIASGGHNIVGSTEGCAFTPATGDLTGVDPKLGPLQDNGGPTRTHALLKGSPAIGAGDPAAPGSGGTACEGTDQRGLPRKDCDIGAYERVLCGKVPVNVIGTDGNDKLKGTNAADGILGFGGKDKLNGAGGKDALCGGKGKDTLKGGGGKDFLKGEQGKDTCIGGGGRDKAKCEKEKKI